MNKKKRVKVFNFLTIQQFLHKNGSFLAARSEYFQFNANWRQPHWEHEFNSLPHLSPESSKAHTG